MSQLKECAPHQRRTDVDDLQMVRRCAMPIRIQLSRKKGWRMPPNTVKVSRPGRWGNPFYISPWRDAKTCVALFRDAMTTGWNPKTSEHLPDAWCGYGEWVEWHQRMGIEVLHNAISELRGKNLACWCKPGEPCHADVLLELANPLVECVAGMG